MPRVSLVAGMAIYMYYDDHNPPHFHVRIRGREAQIAIDNPRILAGRLLPRLEQTIVDWAIRRQDALHENWRRAQSDEPLLWIEP